MSPKVADGYIALADDKESGSSPTAFGSPTKFGWTPRKNISTSWRPPDSAFPA